MNMKLAIVTDSTCDWSCEEYEAKQVAMIPLKIQVDNENFLDQIEISSEEFYDRMIASDQIPLTSQPSPGEFISIYEDLARQGYDAIISLHIAPALSGTCAAAEIAAQSVDIPVIVYDSKAASSQLGLLVGEACRLRDRGTSLDEMVKKLDAVRKDMLFFLTPDSLDNLVKGGRLPEELAQGMAVLKVKIVFKFDEDGRLQNFDKVKGSKGILKRYAEVIEDYVNEFGSARVRFMHARNLSEVTKLIKMLKDKGIDVEVAGVDSCGATVATHTGVGVIGFSVLPLNDRK